MTPSFRQALDSIDAGDSGALRVLLERAPEVLRERAGISEPAYFAHPTLLQYVAENPVRRGYLPHNIVAIAEFLLRSGAEGADQTLMLVASGRVPRECGVQLPLIDLLCDFGADPDQALLPAVAHAELAAASRLVQRGAALTLCAAVALDRDGDLQRLLPTASAEDRAYALTAAACQGKAQAVRCLLDAGADAAQWNPAGFHAHSTALHQAVLSGSLPTVRLLVESGAHLQVRDRLWNGTPLDWARYEEKAEMEGYLLGCANGMQG